MKTQTKREAIQQSDAVLAVGMMAALKYFPSDAVARAGLAADLMHICHFKDQALWLANRMKVLYSEWPGPREMRAAYCAKFRPKDGIEVFSDSYPDGIPSETALPPPRLTDGGALSIEIQRLAEAKTKGIM